MDPIMERVTIELKKQNKTQVDLANYLGISPNVITDWKSGRIKSYTKHIHNMAVFLGVTVDYLRSEEPDLDISLQRILDEIHIKKIKQKDLTDHLGLVSSAFGNWISGRNKSYKKYIHAIADFLNVSVEYLKGETDEKQKPPAKNSGGSLTEFIELFMSLTTEQQALVIAQMKGILANQ